MSRKSRKDKRKNLVKKDRQSSSICRIPFFANLSWSTDTKKKTKKKPLKKQQSIPTADTILELVQEYGRLSEKNQRKHNYIKQLLHENSINLINNKHKIKLEKYFESCIIDIKESNKSMNKIINILPHFFKYTIDGVEITPQTSYKSESSTIHVNNLPNLHNTGSNLSNNIHPRNNMTNNINNTMKPVQNIYIPTQPINEHSNMVNENDIDGITVSMKDYNNFNENNQYSNYTIPINVKSRKVLTPHDMIKDKRMIKLRDPVTWDVALLKNTSISDDSELDGDDGNASFLNNGDVTEDPDNTDEDNDLHKQYIKNNTIKNTNNLKNNNHSDSELSNLSRQRSDKSADVSAEKLNINVNMNIMNELKNSDTANNKVKVKLRPIISSVFSQSTSSDDTRDINKNFDKSIDAVGRLSLKTTNSEHGSLIRAKSKDAWGIDELRNEQNELKKQMEFLAKHNSATDI